MKTKKRFTKYLVLCLSLMMLLSSSVTVFANKTPEEALKFLKAYVDGGGKTGEFYANAEGYALSGGGTASYSDLVKKGIVTSEYANLTSKAKAELIEDMIACADLAVSDSKTTGASDQTKTTWLSELQECNGVGTQLMTTLLQNTKPDYVTANRIYEPWSGIVGTAMALGAILIMATLGLTMVADLGYIGIPWFRLLLDGENTTNGGQGKPKFISFEAFSAVQLVENGTGGNGQQSSGFKVAAGIYLKRRIIMLVILGVCLLYLVQGQIFVLVGFILDLLSGFLGF